MEVSGIENLPSDGAALLVANHAGVLPFDGLMLSVAVHDEHPAHRDLRLLAADMVFDLPVVGEAAARQGTPWPAPPTRTDCWPRASSRPCSPKVTRAWVSASRTVTACRDSDAAASYRRRCVPRRRLCRARSSGRRRSTRCSPMSNCWHDCSVCPISRSLRCSRWPARRTGSAAVEMAHRVREPIHTADYATTDAEDPMVTFELTDQVRETIQQTLYRLLAGRRNIFLG
ncbi:acyltransferase family protein [Mycobacterium kansasii]|uniref:Acyltransferase family protein n=1 Tax=Mycobacterium kansasii TaxID=1768 RepID=A0A1V3WR11_MYCKA|nr:acyltransferase family protein [Mycobacterium kansasii]